MSQAPRWSEQHLKAYQDGKAQAAIPEREHQRAVLEFLQLHPAVAWCHRMNTGAMQVDDRYVKFAFRGCADIIGQMRDGRFMAFECKRVGEKPTADQNEFLAVVKLNGGVASWGQLEHAQKMIDMATHHVTEPSIGE